MMRRTFTAVLVVFATATLWGQSSAGPLATRRQPVAATSNAEGIAAANRARALANQDLQGMENTLTKMHAVLKQMHSNTSSAKDPMAKANLDMWTLMVEQLDKQYEQLRLAAQQREEFESRRAALYKQADEKAAQAARKAQAASTGSNTTQAPAPAGAAQTTTTPQPPAPSPN